MVNYGKLPNPEDIPHGLVTLLIWPSEVHFDKRLEKTYSATRVINSQDKWVTHTNRTEQWDTRFNYVWELNGFNLDRFGRSYLPKQESTPAEVLEALEKLESWWKSNEFE